ncbi:MAG: hypothetical protein JST78_09570 [Bacteroidetes bacterium]|nr:hypothetical protein [Bacteroidota bacterium]
MKKEEVFKENPHLKEAHFTSDGQAFYNENDAKNHAKTLQDTNVECVLNPDHIKVEDAEVVGDDANEMAEFLAEQATTQGPVTTDAAPVTTDAAPVTTDAAPVTTEPAPVTTEAAPVTTEPAPVTTDLERQQLFDELDQKTKAEIIAWAKTKSIEVKNKTANKPTLINEVLDALKAKK